LDASYIKEIKFFWSYAKARLSKFRGVRKNIFELHLKEWSLGSIIGNKASVELLYFQKNLIRIMYYQLY